MQMVARLTPSSRAMEETVLSGRVSRSRARRICSAVMADGRPIPRALTNPLPEPSSGHRQREGQSGRAERRPGARTGASALVHRV